MITQELVMLFEGLDTAADVYLGGDLVLKTRNFHRLAARCLESPLDLSLRVS